MATTRIEDIMSFLDVEENRNTKVASASAPPKAAGSPLQSALSDVLATIGTQKTAAETPVATPATAPVNDLIKMANEIVAIDRDGEIKHAQLVGAAMADAFVSRVNQWEKAAGSLDKTASENETASLEKFASENPEAYRTAVTQGYSDAKALIEKVGQDLYEKSYNGEVERIQKEAAEHFVHGWNSIKQADFILSQKR